MSRHSICPICGNENPEESEFCQICHADLSALPEDMFPAENEPKSVPTGHEAEAPLTDPSDAELDSPIPIWLRDRFKEKPEKSNFDFDSFTDAIFGVRDTDKSTSPTKVLEPKPRKPRKKSPVYQLEPENQTEAPLVEPDEAAGKSVPENIPSLEDFKTVRPMKKWDDPVRDPVIESVREQTEKAFPGIEQMPMLWRRDPALVEDEDLSKDAGDDDEESMYSASPTKLADYRTPDESDTAAEPVPVPADPALEEPSDDTPAESAREESGEFVPESGSLLSDLMNEMNQRSVTPAPQELKENSSGTVFYSGNESTEEKEEPEMIDIPIPAEDNGGSAAFLDQILQGIGYRVEGTAPAEEDPAETPAKVSADPEETGEETVQAASSMFDPGIDPETGPSGEETVDPALDPGYEPEEQKGPDPALIETDPLADYEPIPAKTDGPDEQEIPWDLFGSQDMSLPQSPEDPAYRTFSRSSIPEESGNTTYQQRMMSSVLGKIIRAENYVVPQKKHFNRRISIWARLFWTLAAIGGIVMILMTGISDRLSLPAVPAAPESDAFLQNAAEEGSSALVIIDYTPAYGAELDAAAEGLLRTLEETKEQVRIGVLNPAAMPKTQELLKVHEEKAGFAGWWPAGAVSIRSRLGSGEIPEQVWLLTSESSSVRSWAEQLTVSGEEHRLHVLASGQLEPLLKPYLEAGMVTSAMSRDRDLMHYGTEPDRPDRHQFAVWYLAALPLLAWGCGCITRFLRSEPGNGRKKAADKEHEQISDKEAGDDSSL